MKCGENCVDYFKNYESNKNSLIGKLNQKYLNFLKKNKNLFFKKKNEKNEEKISKSKKYLENIEKIYLDYVNKITNLMSDFNLKEVELFYFRNNILEDNLKKLIKDIRENVDNVIIEVNKEYSKDEKKKFLEELYIFCENAKYGISLPWVIDIEIICEILKKN